MDDEQRTGQDRRTTGGGRRTTDQRVREAYRQLDEAARLTKEANKVLVEAHGRLSDAVTPGKLANITGLKYHTVIRDIASGDLIAVRVQRRSQVRFLVSHEAAAAWLTQIGLAHLVPSLASLSSQTRPAISHP